MKTAELNPNKNYIVGIHPHGIMGFAAFTCFSTESCGFKELFPGLISNLVTLAGVFRLPLFREYAMFLGIYVQLKEVFETAVPVAVLDQLYGGSYLMRGAQ